MVILLDALSVVTQPIYKRKSQQDPINKIRHYLFCKPHSTDNKIKHLSQPLPSMTPRSMHESDKVSSEMQLFLTTFLLNLLYPVSSNSHIRLEIGVRPHVCGHRHLSNTVFLNKS